MTGIPFFIVFVLLLALMILMISRCKVHPFLALLLISLLLGLLGGLPLHSTTLEDGSTRSGILDIMTLGFAGIFSSIGLVIIFGTLIGLVLERTGAAIRLADIVVRFLGRRHPELGIELMGWVVSIPVFCDSGFVILDPIRRALSLKTGASPVAMSVCLSAGLYASHVFIPPTPGPIAAASNLGLGDNLLLVMALGLVVSIPSLLSAWIYSKYISRRVILDKMKGDASAVSLSYDELVASFKGLPSSGLSIAPILLPILLMALSSLTGALGLQGGLADLFMFLGTPVMALTIGMLFSLLLLHSKDMLSGLQPLVDETLRTAGPILFITASGAVLGKVISSTDLSQTITDSSEILSNLGLLFPFLLSALLKTSLGASTVAIITTSSIMAPMMDTLGLDSPLKAALCVMAIGAGAMTVSHANDSYFWVVTRFSGMDLGQGYRTQTAVTLVEGLVAAVTVMLLSLVL